MHRHLHGRALVVDEGVEALLHEIIHGDPARDERFEIHLVLLHHLDRRMVPDLGNGAAQVISLSTSFRGAP
jgi:hypothetical protein